MNCVRIQTFRRVTVCQIRTDKDKASRCSEIIHGSETGAQVRYQLLRSVFLRLCKIANRTSVLWLCLEVTRCLKILSLYILCAKSDVCPFLGAFAKLRKATISLFTYVCLSVHLEQLGKHWTDFHEI
jgi:hypothetical protein